MTNVRLAGIIKESYTDGYGIRYVLFTQGCEHRCKECHNPETWSFDKGHIFDLDEIIEEINDNPLLDGVTLSGGDPLCAPELAEQLIDEIKSRTGLNIWLYTGFTFEECLAEKVKRGIIEKVDVLVDGPYIDNLRDLTLRFRGSSNQRIIDVQKSLKNKVVEILD